jgi:transcriptional regulator with XRE-family HTH domain
VLYFVNNNCGKVMNNFLSRLKDLQKGMNKSEFSRFLGVKQQTLDNYLNGRIPKLDFVVVVCKKCDVTSDWLLGLAPSSISVRAPPLPFPPAGLHAAEAPAAPCPECARLNAIIDALLEQRREAAKEPGRSRPARKSSSVPMKSSLYPA